MTKLSVRSALFSLGLLKAYTPVKTYATIAIADPKAPFEFRAMGPILWTAQAIAVTSILYTVDPLQLREGEGLDEYWFSTSNPFYWKFEEGKDWFFNQDEQPSIWELW